ncbi:unnamed protein product [Paramecium pentaurelia]|uniref:Uncharacterized protein n=1 Tax=Paramecium pentaurelia TaxID=43138 RepID=A0A8S1SFI0_9CILI|nr:unnamed protein product [Paramecium pentaurelia]
MSRYINLQDKSVPCKPLEEFDIKIYREKLNDKYGKSPLASQHTQPISPKKNNKIGNPSFDLLQTKLKEFSNKKSTSPLKSRIDQSSPNRATGIQQQISKIGTLNFTLPSKQMRIGSVYNIQQFNGPISEDRKVNPIRFETEIQEKQTFSQKPITNMIPLHEIMNMRNKLENAQLNVNQISSAYTSEMVKLASVINSQLKKKSK